MGETESLFYKCLLLFACFTALNGCRPEATSPPTAGGPLKVAVMAVNPSDVEQYRISPAQIEGVREVEIRARVTGILKSVHYIEGIQVKAGDLLFRIDAAPYLAAYALAQAQWAQEDARAKQAEDEAARQAKLLAVKATSRKDADDAKAQAVAARAARDVAAAKADLARLDLEYCEVRSPIDGVAGRRLQTQGALINPLGANGLLTTVVRSDDVWVRFGLSEEDFEILFGSHASAAVGADVSLIQADGAVHPMKGYIDYIAPRIDTRLGTIQLRAYFSNQDGKLLAGQFARARVTGRKAKDAYTIPQSALVQAPSGRSVYVVDSTSKAESRTVTVGETIGTDVVILSGLRPGDRVILNQLHKVRHGSLVEIAPRKN